MQLKLQTIILSIILTAFLFSFNNIIFANNSTESLKIENTANLVFDETNLPQKLLYPDFFKTRDELNWSNIKNELDFKFKYLRGIRPVKEYNRCHWLQRKITKFIKEAIINGKLKIEKIDNDFLFKKGSEIERVLSLPSAPTKMCEYHSYGDLTKDCVIYCDYHGIDYESDFFKKHQKQLEASKPFITSEDIAELIIFLPTFIIFIIVLFLLFHKKRKHQQARQ